MRECLDVRVSKGRMGLDMEWKRDSGLCGYVKADKAVKELRSGYDGKRMNE